MSSVDISVATADNPAYARFAPRLRAVLIDSIILTLVLVTALALAVALKSDDVARVFGFTVVAVWLLYEPLLVSLTGSTVGHYLNNLRVVDDRSGRNLSFPKAVARVVIKTILGWVSFIAMALTRRHQAVHDLLTRSTVQVRDLTRARAHDFSGERLELSGPAMPSRMRRVVVTLAYLLLCYLLFSVTVAGLTQAGVVSRRCIAADRCSTSEYGWLAGTGAAWIGGSVLLIVLGWRGRLLGCRIQ